MICRTAVEIVCRSLDTPLSVSERVGLEVHTLFCSPCRRFRKQVKHLDIACRTATDQDPHGEEVLSAVARDRITAALEPPPAI